MADAIKPLYIETTEFTIEGVTPLLMHAWSMKAREAIRSKQNEKAGKAARGRERRDPEEECREATYWLMDGRPGMPAAAFQQAMVRAGKIRGLAMTDLRVMFHILPDGIGAPPDEAQLVAIRGTFRQKESMVRVGTGYDFRYRPEFLEWGATIRVEYDTYAIEPSGLRILLEAAGFSVGIGDWRPEKDGDHGRFRVID